MASNGLDGCENHIFNGTNFALWKNHMLDHFRAKGPKFWWVVTSGLTHVLDHRNLTKEFSMNLMHMLVVFYWML